MPPQNSSGALRLDQDAEHTVAEQEAREAAARDLQKQEAAHQAIIDRRRAIEEAAQALGPEPANGVGIQFLFPGGEKVQRKFSPDSPADDLYAFLAARPEFFDKQENPRSFKLTFVKILEKGQTLAQQGIKGRSQVRVAFDD
jgi:hypothetical protein